MTFSPWTFGKLAAGTLAIGLIAACTAYEAPPQRVAEVVVAPTAEACATYDFAPGTNAYNICAQREHEARRAARAARDYGEARVRADARNACSYYGITPGTGAYDRCVAREWDLRRPL